MSNRPVVYVQNSDYAHAQAAIGNIFRKFPLKVENKLVWVKPNMVGDFLPDRHVTTHPAIISAIVKELLALKAKVVVGDNSGFQSILSDTVVASKTGILEAAQGTFRNLGESVVYKNIDLSGVSENIAVPKIVDECDFMISVPKMKTHLLTVFTGAVKNSYGLVVGAQKAKLHLKYPDNKDFSALFSRIYDLRKPDLVIMDAVYAMEGDGPNCSEIRELNKIIASDCGVALDRYAAKIMGMAENKVPFLDYCARNNIGAEKWELQGDADLIKGFKLPGTFFSSRKGNSLIESLTYNFIINKKVKIDNRHCKRCQKCFKACPAGAISWNEVPLINPHKCILCFCCKEMCEHEAVVFSGEYRIAQKLTECLNYFQNKRQMKKR